MPIATPAQAGIPAASVAQQGGRIRAKFDGLVAPLLGPARAARLGDAIAAIDRNPNVASLLAIAA